MTELDISQMTPEQRLRQIEILLSTVAKNINRHDEMFTQIEQQNIDLNLRLTRLSEIVLDTTRIVAQQQANIEILQAESRQSRIETQRIWEYLMSRSENGNSHH